jgi:nucleotide-binding universal stress UspA family protein
MTYRDILVHLPLPHSHKLVECSVKVARKFGAHLTGVCALELTSMLRDAAQNPFIRLSESEDVAEIIRSEQRQALDAERDFNAASEREGVSHAWQMVEGNPGDLLTYACRLQDLAILGQCGEASELLYGPVVQIVLSGCPAIVVPNSWTSLAANHVLVAWNGSAQASAAVRQALPFLSSAGRVSLLIGQSREVYPGSWRMPLLDIQSYLRRRGIEVETIDFDFPDSEAGSNILSVAESISANLIVMGAYGRSRFKEWVLGGATRLVLERMTVPVFMAH